MQSISATGIIMKAIVRTGTGRPEVLKLQDVEKPVPKDNEILIRVKAGTVTIGDTIIRKIPRIVLAPLGWLFGFKAHKITGTEVAGVVEAAGKDVTRFKAGDAVFGSTTGLSFGGNAEYVCVPEAWKLGMITRKPEEIPFEDAAALSIGGITALQILRKAKPQPGDKVLIYGASGSVGTCAVQLARNHFGAAVTGVCSGPNLEMVKGLGAEKAIDYTKEDFRQGEARYDVIFDTVRKLSRSTCRKALTPGGRYISARSPTRENREDLDLLKTLVAEGKLKVVIDRRFPLEDVPEAHRYVDSRRKRGNVVITVD